MSVFVKLNEEAIILNGVIIRESSWFIKHPPKSRIIIRPFKRRECRQSNSAASCISDTEVSVEGVNSRLINKCCVAAAKGYACDLILCFGDEARAQIKYRNRWDCRELIVLIKNCYGILAGCGLDVNIRIGAVANDDVINMRLWVADWYGAANNRTIALIEINEKLIAWL